MVSFSKLRRLPAWFSCYGGSDTRVSWVSIEFYSRSGTCENFERHLISIIAKIALIIRSVHELISTRAVGRRDGKTEWWSRKCQPARCSAVGCTLSSWAPPPLPVIDVLCRRAITTALASSWNGGPVPCPGPPRRPKTNVATVATSRPLPDDSTWTVVLITSSKPPFAWSANYSQTTTTIMLCRSLTVQQKFTRSSKWNLLAKKAMPILVRLLTVSVTQLGRTLHMDYGNSRHTSKYASTNTHNYYRHPSFSPLGISCTQTIIMIIVTIYKIAALLFDCPNVVKII